MDTYQYLEQYNSFHHQNDAQYQYQSMPPPKQDESIAFVSMELANKELFENFDKYGNEMIITKQGRRMFPSPVVKVSRLNKTLPYFLLVDIVPVDARKYRWLKTEWVVTGKSEQPLSAKMHIHPDSPLTGAQWMAQPISFKKIKLTNNTITQTDHMFLNSMHKYQPRFHVVQANDVMSLYYQAFKSFAFPESKFIAVTAYQNPEITCLKIENNPFAKGFRKDEKKRGSKKKVTPEEHAGPNENANEACIIEDMSSNNKMANELTSPTFTKTTDLPAITANNWLSETTYRQINNTHPYHQMQGVDAPPPYYGEHPVPPTPPYEEHPMANTPPYYQQQCYEQPPPPWFNYRI